jgi:hypothetical protein
MEESAGTKAALLSPMKKRFCLIGIVLTTSLAGASAVAEELALGNGLSAQAKSRCLQGSIRRTPIHQTTIPSSGSISDFGLKSLLGSSFGPSETPESAFYKEATSKQAATIHSDTRLPFQMSIATEFLTEGHLTLDAKKALAESPESFREICGDKLIEQRTLGADLLTNIRVEMMGTAAQINDCKSHLELKKFTSKSHTQANDLAAWSATDIPLARCAGAVIHVSALQRGGSLNRINALFKESQLHSFNVGFGTMTCSIENLSPCLEAARTLEKLASAFRTQITQTKGPNEVGGLAVVDFVAKPYSEFGIVPKPNSALASLLGENPLKAKAGVTQNQTSE